MKGEGSTDKIPNGTKNVSPEPPGQLARDPVRCLCFPSALFGVGGLLDSLCRAVCWAIIFQVAFQLFREICAPSLLCPSSPALGSILNVYYHLKEVVINKTLDASRHESVSCQAQAV